MVPLRVFSPLWWERLRPQRNVIFYNCVRGLASYVPYNISHHYSTRTEQFLLNAMEKSGVAGKEGDGHLAAWGSKTGSKPIFEPKKHPPYP